MPSLLVHLALSGMVAAVLLGEAFDWRSLSVVLAATALADFDTFLGLVSAVGHRTAFHTLVLPVVAGLTLWADLRLRETSAVRGRWGPRGVRIAWVTVLAYAVSAIGLDLVTGGVNLLYPLHDQFYRLDGRLLYSTTRGVVQTFVDLNPETGPIPAPEGLGTASEVHVGTAIDPRKGPEPKNVERIVPVVQSGWQLLLLVAGTGVTLARLFVSPTLPEED